MTPQRRADKWRYCVEHSRNHRDNCATTPDGERLRAIYDAALAAAEADEP